MVIIPRVLQCHVHHIATCTALLRAPHCCTALPRVPHCHVYRIACWHYLSLSLVPYRPQSLPSDRLLILLPANQAYRQGSAESALPFFHLCPHSCPRPPPHAHVPLFPTNNTINNKTQNTKHKTKHKTKPETRNPKPKTQNPKPETRTPKCEGVCGRRNSKDRGEADAVRLFQRR
jgi:hypothetical protein